MMAKADVLYTKTEFGILYYPQAETAKKFFAPYGALPEGGYPFLHKEPDLAWLNGLTVSEWVE